MRILSSISSASASLSFPATADPTNVNDYGSTWTATCNEFTWRIVNFNSYKNTWDHIRCGSKSAASLASIETVAVMPEAIEKVTITFKDFDSANTNSVKLFVDTAADFSSANCQTINVTGKANSDVEVAIPSPTANCYYKLEFDCKQGSANGFDRVGKVVYTNE